MLIIILIITKKPRKDCAKLFKKFSKALPFWELSSWKKSEKNNYPFLRKMSNWQTDSETDNCDLVRHPVGQNKKSKIKNNRNLR